MDQKRFDWACDKINQMEQVKKGIGTLSEKTLHAVLKYYFEPDEEYHEIKIGNYVADIAKQGMIIEIQTANFNKLRNKLDAFLNDYEVTIVYPIAKSKWLLWVDQETGEISKRRKSPKTGQPYEAFFELYKIKSYLQHPNLKLCIVLFDSQEYRMLNGWSEDRKRGSSRSERIPLALAEEISIQCKQDYRYLIPQQLTDEFTSEDYKKGSGISIKRARTALHVLNYLGAVERIGKKGNQFIYRRAY